MVLCPRPRHILHLDADAFFVGCELSANPRLQGKLLAVGGTKRGIIASASYSARKLGVYTPMPTSQALKIAPSLIVIPPDFPKYEKYSRQMFDMIRQYTPIVERGSIDEGYADFSGLSKTLPSQAALALKKDIKNHLGLSVSVGLASNKFVAAVASKLNKPDGFLEILAGAEHSFLAPLEVKWLPSIGVKTASLLHSAGFNKIADVAHSPLERLVMILGTSAPQVRDFALGLDSRQVNPEPLPPQTYGSQESFNHAITDRDQVRQTLRVMADTLMEKVRLADRTTQCVEVRVRYTDWKQKQCSESLTEATDLETDTYDVVDRLLARAWSRNLALRLVGLTFSQVHESGELVQEELGLESPNRQSRRTLALTMDKINKRFGQASLVRAHHLKNSNP